MNSKHLRESIENISVLQGIRLTPEQLILIENSLIVLQNENKFRDIFYWGQINAIENDYFIVFGYEKDCLRRRKFFWSHNCCNWYLLPPEKIELNEICLIIPTKFQGDPTWIESVNLKPEMFYDSEEIIFKIKERKIQMIKEEDRLACIVGIITSDTAIIPRGCLYKRVDRSVIYNPAFQGLSRLEANDITNFQLYRLPKNDYNSNLLKRQDYNYPIDFFDTLDSLDLDEKCFSKIIDEHHNIIFMRSLEWLGMVFYHKLGTKNHGFIYNGDGKKNLDLLFMH